MHLAILPTCCPPRIASAGPFRIDPALMPRALALMPPPDAALDIVAAELERFELPLIVVGRRAVGCGPAIEQLAERLGAPIITALDGKGIVDESHPNALGVLGVFGFPAFEATKRILKARRRHPRHRRRHHQAVPDRAGRRAAPGAHPVRGRVQLPNPRIPSRPHAGRPARRHLRRPTRAGPRRVREPRHSRARRGARGFRASLAAEPAPAERGGAVHPRDFLLRLGEQLPAEAVVVLDTGVHTLWAAQYLRLTRRQRVLVSSHLGFMGFSLPAAIAAQLAAPESPVVAICGDGGFQMVASELGTAVQFGLPLTVVVFNNGVLQNVSVQQDRPFGTALVNPDFVALARAWGADGGGGGRRRRPRCDRRRDPRSAPRSAARRPPRRSRPNLPHQPLGALHACAPAPDLRRGPRSRCRHRRRRRQPGNRARRRPRPSLPCDATTGPGQARSASGPPRSKLQQTAPRLRTLRGIGLEGEQSASYSNRIASSLFKDWYRSLRLRASGSARTDPMLADTVAQP